MGPRERELRAAAKIIEARQRQAMAAKRANGAPQATQPGVGAAPGRKGPWNGDVTIDPSCATVPAAYNRHVQLAMLDLLRKSQTPQTYNPNGPPYVERVLGGGPQSGGRYDVTPSYTDGLSHFVDPTKHGLPRPGDTFIGHSHPSFDLEPNFSNDDFKYRQRGIADFMIYADGTIRCLPGK